MPKIEKTGWVSPISQVRPNSITMRKMKREREADLPRPLRLIGRAARHQDGDEDDVVDAEHDLEHGQGGERRPGLGICEQFEHGGYLGSLRAGNSPTQHEIDGNQA